MKGNKTIIGHIAALCAYTIFGLNIVICKDITTSNLISPLTLFSIRSIGAGILFWIISLFVPQEKIDKKDYFKIFAASVLGFFLTQLTFLVAISQITPMDCSIVNSITPINTMIIAAIVLKEPITLKKAGGVLLSLCGVLYLILSAVTSSDTVTQTSTIGVILIILNSLCFSLYLGVFRPLISKYSVVTFMKWIFLFSTVLSLPITFTELVNIPFAKLPGAYLWELSFLIICATFIAYFLIPIGQKHIRPTLVSMYSYVQPIIAIIISIYVGMDTLSWQKVLAGATVFAGVVMVSYSKGKTE
ncbi:MAG: DMT family transporter [Bacteroidia bacterium]|nr:DMT family transporter [Bacteroidia bacterium]